MSEKKKPGLLGYAAVMSVITVVSKLLGLLRDAPGICLHGKIGPAEMASKMSDAMLTIHTEGFEKENVALVRYSMSTKIAESLMNGPCLLAYGPKEVASIDFLIRNEVAYVITQFDDLQQKLRALIFDESLRLTIEERAHAFARERLSVGKTSAEVRALFEGIVAKGME